MTSPTIQLVHAIFANDSSKIRALLDHGIDINDSGFFNIPPIIRAALYGKSKALQTLIDCGADKNIKDKQGRTALELAQKYNHPEIVQILLKNENRF